MGNVIEHLSSRTLSTSNGRATAEVKYHLDGYANLKAVEAAFGQTASNGVRLPKIGDTHPDFVSLVARDISISPQGGFNDLWEVSFTYEQQANSFGGLAPPPGPLPNQVDYTEVTSDIRAEFYDAWRTGNVVIPDKGQPGYQDGTSGPSDLDDVDADIRGTRIDAAGNPVSIIRRIQEMSVTETVTEPAYITYRSYRFYRNSVPFLGAEAGKVLYRGASVTRTGVNVYQVRHSFVEDEFFHLQQQPLLNDTGIPFRRQDDGRARLVYWVQPFPDLANLKRISTNLSSL